MLTQPLSMLRRINPEPNKRFKILSTCTHEGYQTLLSNINADFYLLTGPNLKGWDFQTRPLPPNHFIHNLPPEHIQPHIKYDLVLCQNRLQTYQMLKDISLRLGIPLVVLDHTEPAPGLTKLHWNEIKTWKGDLNIFIMDHNKKSWEGTEKDIVIPHGIDTEVYKGYTGELTTGVSCVNQFASRDVFCGWLLWQDIRKEVKVDLIGENPGLSQSINNVNKLVGTLAKHRYFLNTSQLSPCPLSVLEAMAVGLPIVTTAKQELPKIITNGVNGFISNDRDELVKYCKILENDLKLATAMGGAARQTIIERFNKTQFVENWNSALAELYESKR